MFHPNTFWRRQTKLFPFKKPYPRGRGTSLGLELLEQRCTSATITVTGTGDDINPVGNVTLREAVKSINDQANVNGVVVAIGAYGTNDTIQFNIPGGGERRIVLGSMIELFKPMTINGYSQPGSKANSASLAFAIDAVRLIRVECGPELTTGFDVYEPAVIRGLIITGFNTGVSLYDSAKSSLIAGCFIEANKLSGITIRADETTIGGMDTADRNLIGSNNEFGVTVIGANGVRIIGNHVGATGTVARPNGTGVSLEGSSNCTIGGILPETGNVISGNTHDGVLIRTDADLNPSKGNRITGNWIGVVTSESFAMGNVENGIHIVNSSENTIGGTDVVGRNIISANGAGVMIEYESGPNGELRPSAEQNVVAQNYIGTNLLGDLAVGNSVGVLLKNAGNNTIGEAFQ